MFGRVKSGKRDALIIGFVVILAGLVCLCFGGRATHSHRKKVGIVFSAEVPYQLRQAMLRSADSRKDLSVLCISTGHRVFDEENQVATTVEKIKQIADVGVDAVGLVYLPLNEQKECLRILRKKGIPSFVVSQYYGSRSEMADYVCYKDIETAMGIAGRYVYSITGHKDRVAVVTDSRSASRRMALAFSNHYCRMAKMETIDIYAVDVPSLPQRFSILPPVRAMESLKDIDILGFRELVNRGMIRRVAIVPECEYRYCAMCHEYVWVGPELRCPGCGYLFPAISIGSVKDFEDINSALAQIESANIETLYVIGDVAPVLAGKSLRARGQKKVKMVATGSELLNLLAINNGRITANVEPDWRDTGNKLLNAIDLHFKDKPNPAKESILYMVKDYDYYNYSSPLELPIGKGIRNNKDF